MRVEVSTASPEDSSVLRNLLELYSYDFSEITGSDVDGHGLFGYRYLDHYWTGPGRTPFLIRVDGQLGGFVLVRVREQEDGGSEASIAEFFVMRKYRRYGVGRAVAQRVFDMFPGPWKIAQLIENVSGRAFWRAVIGEYTGGAFTETTTEDGSATIQRFTVPAGPRTPLPGEEAP